jgi:hypothetical protein
MDREKPADTAHLYASSIVKYINEALPTKVSPAWAQQATKLWAVPGPTPPQSEGREPEPEHPSLPAFHVRRVPLLWLKHGTASTVRHIVVTYDDGDGLVREVHRSQHEGSLQAQAIPLDLGGRAAALTIGRAPGRY